MMLFSLIRGSAYAYLVILAIHMAALALFGGTVLVTDLRLLGIGMRSYSVAEIVNGLRIPKRVGLAAAIVSGALLFGAEAAQYTFNPWFWTKIALLVLIAVNYLIFRRDVYDNAEPSSARRLSGRPKMAAAFSLVLWTGVIVAGRGPATIKDVMHSMVDPNGDYVFESLQQVSDDHGVHEKAPATDPNGRICGVTLPFCARCPHSCPAAERRVRATDPEIPRVKVSRRKSRKLWMPTRRACSAARRGCGMQPHGPRGRWMPETAKVCSGQSTASIKPARIAT